MLSKNQFKLFKSLKSKKGRVEHGSFLVEGMKSVQEALKANLEIECVLHVASVAPPQASRVELIEEADMNVLSSLSTPPGLMAVIRFPHWYQSAQFPSDLANAEFLLILDGIRDPGNLGTIIRTADWFGHTRIALSKDCVDCLNPKVVQASMGSVFRIECHYLNIEDLPQERLVALDLNGDNLYRETSLNGLYIIGSESHGVRHHCEKAVTIPGKGKAESLNAAVSASILLSQQFSLA